MSSQDKMILLTRELVKQSCKNDSRPTNIRLIKFHYLCDLYFAVENNGRTLSGWTWKFHHYGPWAFESLDVIDKTVKSGLIKANQYESRYNEENDYTLYYIDENDPKENCSSLEKFLSFNVRNHLMRDVDRFCDSTSDLLHHVYFNTVPMRDAKPGEALQFNAEVSEVIKKHGSYDNNSSDLKLLSKKQIKKGRALLKQLHNQMNTVKEWEESPELYDEVFRRGMEILNSEEMLKTDKVKVTACVKELL